MSFSRFIFYCAVMGGWAAFLTWGVAAALGLYDTQKNIVMRTTLIALFLGVFVAFTIGFLDAMLNARGFARLVRPMVCTIVGMIGGGLAALIGSLIYTVAAEAVGDIGGMVIKAIIWIATGFAIGFSIGVFDVMRSMVSGAPMRMSIRKVINGILGGAFGGILGGLSVIFLDKGAEAALGKDVAEQWNFHHALGLVILGVCIGLMIGSAQVVLREAWIKVEAGFRPGREMMLSKAETTVGRAEGVDIAMFGDKDCEKLHAKIVLQKGRYYLVDNGTPGGTFLNGERITSQAPLRSGDLIQVGRSALRFGERQKRAS